MCDTVVVTREASADGCSLFAKNSDREPDEAQILELHESATHRAGARIACTYLTIDQAPRTHRVLLSRPVWMWGAEMGANEHGLCVGNEAVFTTAPRQALGLTGMDLVRLTLERATSAEQGVRVLTGLLEEHGQGGPGGYRNKRFVYDNSFLLADPDGAWVLETAGRAWVAARVRGVRAISNALTLRERYDRASAGLAAYAREHGRHRGRGAVDFSRSFTRRAVTSAAAARPRRSANETYLRARAPSSLADVMAALRQHGDGKPGRGLFLTVCAHASWLPTRRSGQTTSSLVSHLAAGKHTHFVTGTAAPCTSVFKPLWLDSGLDGYGPPAGEHQDDASLWWRHEALHRHALADLAAFLSRYAPARDRLEGTLVEQARHASDVDARRAITKDAFETAAAFERQWLA